MTTAQKKLKCQRSLRKLENVLQNEELSPERQRVMEEKKRGFHEIINVIELDENRHLNVKDKKSLIVRHEQFCKSYEHLKQNSTIPHKSRMDAAKLAVRHRICIKVLKANIVRRNLKLDSQPLQSPYEKVKNAKFYNEKARKTPEEKVIKNGWPTIRSLLGAIIAIVLVPFATMPAYLVMELYKFMLGFFVGDITNFPGNLAMLYAPAFFYGLLISMFPIICSRKIIANSNLTFVRVCTFTFWCITYLATANLDVFVFEMKVIEPLSLIFGFVVGISAYQDEK